MIERLVYHYLVTLVPSDLPKQQGKFSLKVETVLAAILALTEETCFGHSLSHAPARRTPYIFDSRVPLAHGFQVVANIVDFSRWEKNFKTSHAEDLSPITVEGF